MHSTTSKRKKNDLSLAPQREDHSRIWPLIHTNGVPVRITKNTRICGDCHSAFKFISEFTRRDIIMRDNARFLLFKFRVH
ncbi:hypothetical protein MLD38_039614 [Melastoma candidum]|uniref:Uncharacterized protein n=1 Tax=Melastoma candidum TaxID=119954 RepID=A0ACB9L3D1_9MYRT|nr:hypothetical protein MLD38_039614 [Melastoma candidum]